MSNNRWNDTRVAVPAFSNLFIPLGTRSGNMGVNPPHVSPNQPVIVTSAAEQRQDELINTGNSAIQSPSVAPVKQCEPLSFTSSMPVTTIMDSGSRYLKIHGPIQGNEGIVHYGTINAHWGTKTVQQKIAANEAMGRFCYFIAFDDIRDSIQALPQLHAIGEDIRVDFIDQPQYAAAHGIIILPNRLGTSSKYDGQVMFQTMYTAPKKNMDPIDKAAMDMHVRDVAESFGPVRVFREDTAFSTGAWQFRVEYWAITSAKVAIQSVPQANPYMFKRWEIYAKAILHVPNDGSAVPRIPDGAVGIRQSLSSRSSWTIDQYGRQIPRNPTPQPMVEGVANVGLLELRDRGYSAPSTGTSTSFEINNGPRSHSIHGIAPMMPTVPNSTLWERRRPRDDEATRIHPDKIINGQDMRTTVMIRNLPNYWTCHDLKTKLDGLVFGRYDFSYLRIDFKKNKNMGYCFVNLENVADVELLHKELSGENFGFYANGDKKLCQVSYASTQGAESAIQRFRNSAVTDECADYCPKLWFTERTAPNKSLIGTERAIPPPDNEAKKRRSQENAATIGLYAPRSRFQHGSRGHRSQYDRGTPAFLQEEAILNMIASNGGGVPNYQALPPVGQPSYTMVPSVNLSTLTSTYPRTVPNMVGYPPTNGYFSASRLPPPGNVPVSLAGPRPNVNAAAIGFGAPAHHQQPPLYQGQHQFQGHQPGHDSSNGRNTNATY